MDGNITALVSLIGVVFGFLIFYLGRRAERLNINKALLGEIKRLLKVLQSHKKYFDNCVQSGKTDVPLIPFSTPVYDQHAKNIGMFKGKWVASVASFYGYLQFINSLQKARGEYIMLNKRQEFDEIYQRSLDTICKDFANAFQNAFKAYKV